jgi:hypothetical protein
MTPEQKLELAEIFLRRLASTNDGDVQSLLKANQEAAEILSQINKIRRTMVLEIEVNPDIPTSSIDKRWLEHNVTHCSIISVD